MDGQKKTGTVHLIVNGILIVAVIILYVLYFINDKDEHASENGKVAAVQSSAGTSNTSASTMVFVNSDLLLEKYALVEKLAGQLENETRRKDADFTARQKEFESEAAYFQESVANQSLNEQSAQRIYEQLMVKQQELYQLQEQYTAEIGQKEFQMNMVLLDSVKNYLDRMNSSNKYDFILNYNAAGSILKANNAYDITDEVLEGLNKEYNEKYAPAEK